MIFYFHGFSSGASSRKATVIKKYFGEYEVYVPDYPSHQPERSICYLGKYIQARINRKPGSKILLMGSSLGGFYAQYLATQFAETAAAVLINPCLQPKKILLDQVGEQLNMVTGERFYFTEEDRQSFSVYEVPQENLHESTLVLVDEGDEIIDYRHALEIYHERGRVLVYPGGDHWFQHLEEALPEVEFLYKSKVVK